MLLNTEASIDLIKSYKPDQVILAAGAVPTRPPIPGIENAIQSWNLLDGSAEMPKNKKATIIGGGIVGCEVATLLTEKGNTVTVIEMLPKYASGLELSHKLDLDAELVEKNIAMKLNSMVTNIQPSKLSFIQDNKEQTVEAEVIYLAIGQKSCGAELAAQLEMYDIPYVVVGDASKPGKIMKATYEGFFAAINI